MAASTNRQTIRVFISSTFSDMHAERDRLVRIVFPILRARCQKRGAEFVGVDLRWGVTSEEARRGEALRICMEEIEHCRPFFVCFLGERFGSVPPPSDVPASLFEEAGRDTSVAPEIRDFLDRWYRLDENSVPPVYRLSFNTPVPEEESARLTEFWVCRGLPFAGESITAREVIRGVLDDNYPYSHGLFYFRRPGVADHPSFPAALAPGFKERDPRRRDRLDALKRRIRNHAGKYVVRDYESSYGGMKIDSTIIPAGVANRNAEAVARGTVTPEDWPDIGEDLRETLVTYGVPVLNGMDELGNMVLDDLWKAIQPELESPKTGKEEDEHEAHGVHHERFAEERADLFVGRHEEINRVMRYALDPDERYLLTVRGPAGVGKSAFMARCVSACRRQNSDALVLPYFVGAVPDSTDLHRMLRYVLEALRRACSLNQAPSVAPEQLLAQLPGFLEQAGRRRRVVLFLDALNQLDDTDEDRVSHWLPTRLPEGVHLIVSTLAGSSLHALDGDIAPDQVLELGPLQPEHRTELAEALLSERRKKLTPAQMTRFMDVDRRPDVRLPLYLVAALEELCLFGSHLDLDRRIDALPPTIERLFDQVLSRLELDHGHELTRRVFRWLATSPSGLSESEILDLLRAWREDVPTLHWRRLYYSCERHLRPFDQTDEAGASIGFHHSQFRLTCYQRYFDMSSVSAPPTQALRNVHAELAHYLSARGYDHPRTLSDLVPHLIGAGMDEELRSCFLGGFLQAKDRAGIATSLVQRDFLAALAHFRSQKDPASMFLVASQWHQTGQHLHLMHHESFLIWHGAVLAHRNDLHGIANATRYIDAILDGQERVRMMAEFLIGLGNHRDAQRLRKRWGTGLRSLVDRAVAKDGLDVLAAEAVGDTDTAFNLASRDITLTPASEDPGKSGTKNPEGRRFCRLLRLVRRHPSHPKAPSVMDRLLAVARQADDFSASQTAATAACGLLRRGDRARQTWRSAVRDVYGRRPVQGYWYPPWEAANLAACLAEDPTFLYAPMAGLSRLRPAKTCSVENLLRLQLGLLHFAWFDPSLQADTYVRDMVEARCGRLPPVEGFDPWLARILQAHIWDLSWGAGTIPLKAHEGALVPVYTLWARIMHDTCTPPDTLGGMAPLTPDYAPQFQADIHSLLEWVEMGQALCCERRWTLAEKWYDRLVGLVRKLERKSTRAFIGSCVEDLLRSFKHFVFGSTIVNLLAGAAWTLFRLVPAVLTANTRLALTLCRRPGSLLDRQFVRRYERRIRHGPGFRDRLFDLTGAWPRVVAWFDRNERGDLARAATPADVLTPVEFLSDISRLYRKNTDARQALRWAFAGLLSRRDEPRKEDFLELLDQLGTDEDRIPPAGLRLVRADRIRFKQLLWLVAHFRPGRRAEIGAGYEAEAAQAIGTVVDHQDFVQGCKTLGRLRLSRPHELAARILQVAVTRPRSRFLDALFAVAAWPGLRSAALKAQARREYMAVIREEYTLGPWADARILFGLLRFLYRQNMLYRRGEIPVWADLALTVGRYHRRLCGKAP